MVFFVGIPWELNYYIDINKVQNKSNLVSQNFTTFFSLYLRYLGFVAFLLNHFRLSIINDFETFGLGFFNWKSLVSYI